MSDDIELSNDELFHLALRACEDNQHDQAILNLKTLLARGEDPKARFLLAAEHAEIGMLEQAIVEMEQVVEFDPEFSIARFQLGLMHLTLDDPDAALLAWDALDALADDDPVKFFKKGLVHLIHHELAEAREALVAGIELNPVNLPLNYDMQRVVDNIDQHRPTHVDQQPSAQAIFSGIYGKSQYEN